MPRSPDLVISILINKNTDRRTEPIAFKLPLAYVHGVILLYMQ